MSINTANPRISKDVRRVVNFRAEKATEAVAVLRETMSQYGSRHPEMEALSEQIAALEAVLASGFTDRLRSLMEGQPA